MQTVPQPSRHLHWLRSLLATREPNAAIIAFYMTGAYSCRERAEYFGVHLTAAGRIVRRSMQRCEN